MSTSPPTHVCLLAGPFWRVRGCPSLWPGSESTQQTLARPSRHAIAFAMSYMLSCLEAYGCTECLHVSARAIYSMHATTSAGGVWSVTFMSGHTQVIMDIVGCLITCATCHLILEQLTRVLAVG